MPRVKSGPAARRRHKKILKQAKGYRGAKHRTFRHANENLLHALDYAYRDRRCRKRNFRRLWILRINAGCRAQGKKYSEFMAKLRAKGVILDRKALAHLAMHEPDRFRELLALAFA